jgi:DNA-binding phage protein
MTEDEAIAGIRKAAEAREYHAKLRRAVTYEMRDYCRAALDAGVSMTRVAREAGLSRQGVYDLLGHPPPA